MSLEKWQRLSTETLLRHNRLVVVEDEVELPQGIKTKYLRFEGIADYVSIIAIAGDDLALVSDYSYPHDEWLLQLPEGVIDADETPQDAAARELLEETGLTCSSLTNIGLNYGHHRRSTEKNFIFLADNCHQADELQKDDEEYGMRLRWTPRSEVKELIIAGDIRQKNALAALGLYFMMSGELPR